MIEKQDKADTTAEEDSAPVQEQKYLNVFNDLEAVEIALELMGDYWPMDRNKEYSLKNAIKQVEEIRAQIEAGTYPKDWAHCFSATVYGSGGCNRYFLRLDGTLEFSEFHGRYQVKDAEDLGFKIFR